VRYRFRLQDPTAPQTTYLYEEIVAELDRASTIEWRSIFAFASELGINALLEDPAIIAFLERGGRWSLIVGLDAITDPPALERLKSLSEKYSDVQVRVFHNSSRGLFHPKIAHFTRRDGTQVVVVGSGNLTPGGLRGNIEGFSVTTFRRDEGIDLAAWDSFLERHAGSIRPIDEEALKRADLNRRVARTRPPRAREAEPEAETTEEPEGADVAEAPDELARRNDRMLVAEVPKAGGRWHQVHFNGAVVEAFFRVRPNTEQRVFLRELLGPGRLGPVEARPCVYSEVNKNHRIELAARRGEDYPEERRPILVARETGLRTFQYIILMPDETGHPEMESFVATNPSVGRGTRRVITSRREVLSFWAGCPV
jgi:HKD family nuclease